MHQELIRELAMITDEERRILEGKQEIDPQLYTEKKEMVVDSAKLLKKGKLIQVRPHTRFVHFPAHTHNYIEVIYMCQGTTTHIVNGNQVVLEQGDLLFLNQNAVQEILPAGEYDIAVNFIVLPEFFNTAFSMIGAEENQYNVKWFLENYPFVLESIDPYICDELKGKTTSAGYLQLLPGIHKSDGFFDNRGFPPHTLHLPEADRSVLNTSIRFRFR